MRLANTWVVMGVSVLVIMAAGKAGAAEAIQPALDGTAILEEAGRWYDQRGADQQSVSKAVALYQQRLTNHPTDFQALWRLARCYWWMGDHAEEGKRIALFDQGKALAEKAQQAAPDKSEGYYWAGVCLGRAAEERGVMNSLFAVDGIAKSMEKAIAIDPKDGTAQHVLGVLYRKAPGWPLSRGDMKKSLAFAQQAVANRPDVVLHYIGLAETLAAMGKKAEAKDALKQALELPGPEDLQPETKRDQAKARELLKTL